MICFIISHYPTFLIQLFYKIPTHRTVQQRTGTELIDAGIGFLETIKLILKYILVTSHYHARTYHARIILQSAIIITLVMLYRKSYRPLKIILIFWGYIIFASFIHGIYYYEPILNAYLDSGFGFNYGRFHFLNPAAWYLLWAICLIYVYTIMNDKKLAQILIIFMCVFQIMCNSKNSVIPAFMYEPSFREAVSEEQFDEIERKLGGDKKDYRIGCIGFLPSIANYNGFKTLGAYTSYYPLEFKQKFYPIIQKELEKNREIEDHFIKWGSQAFLYDDQVGLNIYDQEFIKCNISEIKCELNVEKLKNYDIKYVFSTAKIENANDIGLEQVLTSHEPRYYYRFYIYLLN